MSQLIESINTCAELGKATFSGLCVIRTGFVNTLKRRLLPLLLVATGLGGNISVAQTSQVGSGVKKDGQLSTFQTSVGASARKAVQKDKVDRFIQNGYNVAVIGARIQEIVDHITNDMRQKHVRSSAVAIVYKGRLWIGKTNQEL